MKMKKSLYLAFAAMAFTGTAVLTGCQADMDAPAFEAPVATIQANTTIAELKTAFADRTEMIGLKNEETTISSTDVSFPPMLPETSTNPSCFRMRLPPLRSPSIRRTSG